MNYRFTELLASESTSTAATKTLDINIANPISKLLIRFKGTNSSSTPTAHPAKMVKKIEVVDGSDVLFSLSGVQVYGLNFMETGELPFTIAEYEDNIEVCATYAINFGRFLMDPDLALDPSRFNNLQLKITHDKALGGSAPDAGTMAVFAFVFDEKRISPRGFLMSKEMFTYTLTAGAAKYVDLATDHPYRFVAVQTYEAGYAMNTQIGTVKLTIDNDRKVLLNDISMSEFLKAFPIGDKVEEDFAVLGTGSAVAHYIASTYENYGGGVGRSAAGAGIIVAQPSGPTINITNDSSESAAIHCNGYAPMGTVNLLLADKMKMEDWFDPMQFQSVQVKITAGSGASGTIAIVTQQFRRY